MKFTEATENDISLIQDLARRSWNNAYAEILSKEQIEYMLGTMYSREEISSHLKNPNYYYYLISDDSKEPYKGFLGFENHYESVTTKLHRIYLIPESKGKGFGKAALEFLTQKVSESGDKRVILNVNKYNSARNFYESQGYRIYDQVVLDVGNNFVMDDYLMEFIFHS